MLRLDNVLRDAENAPTTVVVEHPDFRRSHQQVQCGADVEADLLRDFSRDHGVTLLHARFRCRQPGQLSLLLDGAREAEHGRGYLASHPAGGHLWLPAAPVARRYDQHSRIESEEPGEMRFSKASGTLEICVSVQAGDLIDIPLVHGHGEGDRFLQEVGSAEPVEQIRLHQDDWYDVRDVTQLWQYLIYGRVHDPRWKATHKRVECQQCAHTWYAHLAYLHRQTGKSIYGALRDVVAYAVLLSLPGDRRWRHGSWTDGMETHTRFQTDGIHLLVQHFALCGHPEFLDAACGAADYLIEIADTLDTGSRWYVHDTLELGENPEQAGYPLSRRSRAFGKHPGNTLCLNTHAWTLTAFSRLAIVCQGERRQAYEQAFARGMQALKTVLSADAGDALYGRLYALRDACLRWRARAGVAIPLRLYDALLHRILRRLKPRLARLAMPDGYIERDLERTTLSDRYVPVNLKDLALLSRLTGAEWLRPFVKRGLSHWIWSGLCLKEVAHSGTAQQTLDAALLLAVDDGSSLDQARWIFSVMHSTGRATTVDALTGTAGSEDWTLRRLLPDVLDEIVSARVDSLAERACGNLACGRATSI